MKTNVFGAPPEPSTPAADVPPRSRLRGVVIFEQSGALASTPCAFRFQAALEPMFESAFLKCYVIVNSGSEIGLPGRISIGFKHGDPCTFFDVTYIHSSLV